MTQKNYNFVAYFPWWANGPYSPTLGVGVRCRLLILYVDDATLEAVHASAEVVRCTNTGATDHMAEHLQAGLEFEVSVRRL